MVLAHQIETDGRTVWVNAPDGMNVARFGPRGVDVHKTTAEQLVGGSHCADCFPRTGDNWADWQRFRDAVKRTHALEVPYDFRPSETGAGVRTLSPQDVQAPDEPEIQS